MHKSDYRILGSLLVLALISTPGLGQIAPLVPLGDAMADEAMLPAGISRSKPEMYGQYVHVWEVENGTHVIQYYGDFALSIGARRLASRDAVIWMRKTQWKELSYYHYEVFLSLDAIVRDGAGTVSSGPTLFVTFNSFQPPAIEMDSDSVQPSADSRLFREASRVRAEVVAGKTAVGEPAGMAVVDLGKAAPPEQIKPRPIIRFRSKDPAVIDEKNGTVTLTGAVYISQGLIESGQFLEVRANAAVLFLLRPEQGPEKGEKDVLALENIPSKQPWAGGQVFPGGGANPFGGIGGAQGGQASVAGVYLKGDVVLTRGEQMIRASELYYDLENDRALILDAVIRAIIPGRDLPLYVRAQQVRQLSSTEYMARKAMLSTSEFHTPHMHLGAEKVYLTDATPRGESGEVLGLRGGRFRAYDATLTAEGVPLIYLPYVAGDFREEQAALRGVNIGYGDDFGLTARTKWYLFNLLGTEKPAGVDAILLTDYFSKRGPGFGLNVDYETEDNFGIFRGYYIRDTGTDDLGNFRDGTVKDPDRGRITWRHRQFFKDGWELTLEGSYISDPNFLEEYFNREFEQGKEQETLAYLKKQKDNWAFTALTQWRVLDFLTQTEHWPDLAFTWVGEPLGNIASFYSESHTGWSRYLPDNRRFFDKRRFDNTGRSGLTYRGDTRNELDFPLKLGNAQIVPYAMARTGYWDSSPHDGSLGRLFGTVGTRASTQFWRVFDGFVSRIFDVTGLRHIIKPEATAWASASNHDSLDLHPFDRGIEDIDDFLGTSLALRQRWQTKRGGPGNWRVVDWITLDVELNLFANVPEGVTRPIGRYYDERPENSNPRDHVRVNGSWRISDTSTLLTDANYDLDDGSLDLFDISYAVERTPRFSYVLGYRRINDMNANLIGLGSNYEINSKYKTALRTYYDIERNNLQTLDVTIIRKWPRWYSALTFGLDRIEKDIHVSLSVWPEGAPQMALGSRRYSGLGESTGIRPDE